MSNENALNLLQEQINNLIIQKNNLENEILKSKSLETEYKTKAKLYDIISERNILFQNKIDFVLSFLSYLGKDSCVYGSFVRKLFDYSLRFNKLKNINTGNFENSDINIIFMNSNYNDKTQVVSDFYNTIHYIECLQLISPEINHKNTKTINQRLSNEDLPSKIGSDGIREKENNIFLKKNRLENSQILGSFNGYNLFSKKEIPTYDNNNKIIPRFLLEFHKVIGIGIGNPVLGTGNKKEDIIRVNIICWRPNTHPEFSVNNFYMNSSGIFKTNYFKETTFLEYLSNIKNSETIFNSNLKDLQDLAFPDDYIVPHHIKITFLNKIYKNLSYSLVKMIENDFDIKGLKPNIQIENKDDCIFTGCVAPYPTIELECNHKISIMAYKGFIVNQIDESTESIRCPYCRKDLKLKFVYEPPQKIYNLKKINFSSTANENFRQIIKTDFISKDSYDNL